MMERGWKEESEELGRKSDPAPENRSMRRESPPVQPSLKDQLHFVVEVVDRVALSRGMQGLMLHVARALNWHWGRKGLI